MSQTDKQQDKQQLLELIGTKPKCKNALRKMTKSEFEKFEKVVLSSFADVSHERAEAERKEKETQQAIETQLSELSSELGISITELKSRIVKS